MVTYGGDDLPGVHIASYVGALPVVAFCWMLQHSFIPLILDWHYVAWRFLAFLPGVIAFVLIYAWTKRLPPIIVAHWAMDILAVSITLKF